MSASVSDVQFEGKMRVVLQPLVGFIPIVGGVQVYFLQKPLINFELGGAASILDLPGLNGLLMDAIQDQVEAQLILPNKISVILSDKVSAEELRMPRPVGVLLVRLVEAKSLLQTDTIGSISPYAQISLGGAEHKSSLGIGTNPSWSDKDMEFPVEVPDSEELQLLLQDKDMIGDDDFLGSARLNVEPAAKHMAIDTWVTLEQVETGQVRLKLYWLPVSLEEKDYKVNKILNQPCWVLKLLRGPH